MKIEKFSVYIWKIELESKQTKEDFEMNQTNNEFLEKMREVIREEISKIDVRKMSFDRCINNIVVILENYKSPYFEYFKTNEKKLIRQNKRNLKK